MITTKKWHGRPLALDENQYYYQQIPIFKDALLVRNKKNNDIIFTVICPGFILQLGENEFITTAKINENIFRFEHLYYHKDKGITEKIFEREYKPKNLITGSIEILDNIFIIRGYLSTTIYNRSSKKSITLDYSTIEKLNEPEYLEPLELEYSKTNDYLKAQIEISTEDCEKKDYLTMIIPIRSLEFEEFYSREQDRIIPVIKNAKDENNSFETRFKMTVEKEVRKYLYLLEERDKKYQKNSLKNDMKLLIKKKNKET